MGDPCEEWMILRSRRASRSAPSSTASIRLLRRREVEYQMRDGGAAIFIAEDQEYVDKILPLADRLPA